MTSETLTAQHREYVYSVAMKYLRDEQAAEDVAQEALLLAHRYRASFHGKSRFSTWLYRRVGGLVVDDEDAGHGTTL